jgi:hypothetical protein
VPAYGFGDVAKAWTVLLRPFVDNDPGRIGTSAPADLDDRLPFIRVRRTGGPTDRVNDAPTLLVDVFADTYAVAEPLAGRIRDWLLFNGPHKANGLIFDRIGCDSSPQELPWSDTATVRRFGATYTCVFRAHRLTS